MKVLFVCNQNKHRSKTAEVLFKDLFGTKSAGLYNDVPVTREQVLWADLVVTMEDAQVTKLSEMFPKEFMLKKFLNIDVPDIFQFNQPELVELLKEKVRVIQLTAQ
jgi:predicted protein tyrosine phosphatase